jgi:FkbM family methyltransferase
MSLKNLLKKVVRSLGIDISRLSSLKRNRNQPADDPFLHQKRLLLHKEVRVVFDVGANYGQTVRKYQHFFPEAVIYCFEPFDAGFSTISNAFKGCPLVKPYQLAISDSVGMKQFHCTTDSVMNSLLPLSPKAGILSDSRQAQIIEVRTSTLDAFCQEHKIATVDILKLDIQGGELLALRGASRLLMSKAIDVIYCEVNFNEIYTGQAFFHDISKFLYDCEYTLYGLFQVAYCRSGPIGWADAVFISPAIMEKATKR